MPSPVVRRALPADATELSTLAALTFRETFSSYNSAEDMRAHEARSYSPEIQAAEIRDPASATFLAEVEESGACQLAGYAYIGVGHAPDCVVEPKTIELRRLYLSSAWHGRGVAQLLMSTCIDEARRRQASSIWLGVWERNPRAVAFYEKFGFKRIGHHIFTLGADPQTDWIMERPV